MNTTRLIEQVLQLDASDRLALLELLHESLDAPDPAIDSAWTVEAERRLAAYRAGHLPATDAEAVFARL